MKKATTIRDFVHRYPVSKTLRFELIPQGSTLSHIESKGLLEQDEHRADSYKKVKKIIDAYHKYFIDCALSGVRLNGIDAFEINYRKADKTDAEKKELPALKADLRKQISESFTKSRNPEVAGMFKNLFAKELIKENLIEFVQNDSDREILAEFKEFTSYFTGFHDNRKNIYTPEEKSTGVAYRLIHENLPKFLDNIRVYESITQNYPDLSFQTVLSDLDFLIQGKTLEEVFVPEYFNELLTQKGIEWFNVLLGGVAESNRKIKGLNEQINLYRQKRGLNQRQLPNFKPLYKQILSDRESISFIPDAFEKDQEVLDSIENFYREGIIAFENSNKKHNCIQEITELLGQLNEFDQSKIFIRNDGSLSQISQHLFNDWNIINKALEFYYDTVLNPIAVGKKITDTYLDKREKWIRRSSHFSIQQLEDALNAYQTENETVKDKLKPSIVSSYFSELGKTPSEDAYTVRIYTAYEQIKDLLNTSYPEKKNLAQTKEDVYLIKNFLDAIKDLLHFLKPLHPKENDQEKDTAFYNAFLVLYDQFNLLTPLYNKTRNYLTRKPYSTEKIKLNFENSTLMYGWDLNKETDNTTVLLRKNGLYYLGIMDKKYNKLFRKLPVPKPDEEVYEKMEYKLLHDPYKMLPKVFFSKKNIDMFKPSASLLEKYENESHKKGPNFRLEDCHALIDFFKASIAKHEDWKTFDFKFSPTSSYEDLSGFYREVQEQGYKVKFRNISAVFLDQLVEEGKLYLFQIYNKDFSSFSKGKPNLHTLYWNALFDERNLQSVVYKLNGKAEVFYRKKSLNYDEAVLKNGHHQAQLKDKFKYPIISNKRFAFDKFQFHVPITMNFKANGTGTINQDVLTFLKNNPDVNIIGIDRGERHLLYVTMIDRQRRILENGQFSLNEIINAHKGVTYKKDYHALLDQKETQRNEARRSWGLIENIKELKDGYLSQVVHQVALLMVKHNAVLIMEDLNTGFKRGRQKVEKQVYQKFEKMLIDKLNYLVFKYQQNDLGGGLYSALQLTNKFEGFKQMGKQCGFIFYVPAALTSKIDPLTGYVNFLQPKYESVDKSKEFFSRFNKIVFNPEKQWFEFTFDYSNFTTKAEGSRTEWTVCTTPDTRYVWNPKKQNVNGKGGYDAIDVTQKLELLMNSAGIHYNKGENLITEIVLQSNASFYKELMYLLGVTLNLRHNNGEKGALEEDFILSPVATKEGRFFNSKIATEQEPCNADANGAYHIALKGLWILKQIDETDNLSKNVKLAVSNKEWLQFVQNA